ncbi:MAG: molybdenum cofactor biosynthesis protein MoaE [Candidatus Binatia bacterium]|nr:molybdenum cofactor biosynthesis protein MoaE [Candidatus Binatia bacterium]
MTRDTNFQVQVLREPIDTARLLAAVADPSCGATVLFVGSTRDHNEGRRVLRLEYEAYEEMAEREMEKIVRAALAQWRLGKIAAVHRLGPVPLGEASVAVAVSAPHRNEAFAAARYTIDELKNKVPIWKKEMFEGGELWIGLQQSPSSAKAE